MKPLLFSLFLCCPNGCPNGYPGWGDQTCQVHRHTSPVGRDRPTGARMSPVLGWKGSVSLASAPAKRLLRPTGTYESSSRKPF